MSKLIFNHHCLPYSKSDDADAVDPVDAADAAMPEFLKICLKADRLRMGTVLFGDERANNWFDVELAPGYLWRDWHNKGRNQDEVQAFLNIATRSPTTSRQPFFTDDEIDPGEADNSHVCEQSMGGSTLPALQAALWHDAPLLSFPVQAPWNMSPLTLVVQTLDPTGKWLPKKPDPTVVNLYSMAVLDQYAPVWKARCRNSLQSGKDIWKERGEIFGSLAFCGDAKKQLRGWGHNPGILDDVKMSFEVLNAFAEKWCCGHIKAYSHNELKEVGKQMNFNIDVTGESKSCGNDPKRKMERTFRLSDGTSAYFENHIKLSNGIRIHFFPDARTKTVYVAYVGIHLN